ncbi:LysR family transcriptional regulator [Paenibacillus sp. GSMTC-2017]|uniref:LysR family transcriptional regulator n=1 Tax=Paenibacillus sp. GSMTC-2017 TaxID=2794350 RepID=UPI0018D67951|nr:LysR family transcriptional regulator [Paenibacillus sp. GSMTC-2017]MBH5318367.1 LysR family transcriptional regulator [Paenibacillus sp. GSMTC-2017]
MELLQLRYFQKVAKLEHMTRAAEELRVAQPALSKTISRLEEHVGVPLFDRLGGRIRLNSFGKVYLQKVNTVLSLLEEAQKEVTELAGMEHGSIHLATLTLTRLSEPLGKFLSLNPDVNMQITQASTGEITRLIENGEVDIGFTAMPIDLPGIAQATVLKEDLYLAVPQGHRLANRQSIRLIDAAEEPFIGYKEKFVFQKMNDLLFQEAGMSPRFVCRVDDPATIVSLVRSGLGVALFGCKSGENSELTLLPIEHPICQRDYQFIWSEKRYLSLAARKFRDFIIQYYSD